MSDHSVHFTSKTPEHYTPLDIIERAVACLRGIDLDPCSNNHAAPHIPATQHFTAEDDGLAQAWHGKIYMNPPYGREIARWVTKMGEEHKAGRVTEAIALVPARTDTRWWQALRDHPVCLIRGRLRFVGECNTSAAPFPSAIFYLGHHANDFLINFEGIGDICTRLPKFKDLP